jgi:hypothetical protein
MGADRVEIDVIDVAEDVGHEVPGRLRGDPGRGRGALLFS